jgi:hypothetical protein
MQVVEGLKIFFIEEASPRQLGSSLCVNGYLRAGGSNDWNNIILGVCDLVVSLCHGFIHLHTFKMVGQQQYQQRGHLTL